METVIGEDGAGTVFREEGAGTDFRGEGVGTVFRGEGAGTVFKGEGAGTVFRGEGAAGTACLDSNLSPTACDWTDVSSRIAVSSECMVGPCARVAFLLGRLLAAVVCDLALAPPERVARRALVSVPVGCGQGREGGDGLKT